ncbi:uncharacterized protein LOC127657644 [Xyrauchen texanus]|uniref:uncharacterized protein LOC127657644 n=1 Tax=Xyrauchen texanus TaxID=154827 RepID=UPI0022425CA1|nr:uncharacterized protein LOC127657644 [Xyrauchen texanus]
MSAGTDNSLHVSLSGRFSDCTVITWSYKKQVNSGAVDLFTGGKKMNNIGRHERLSLGNNCSLNIYKATGEDYGLYNCRQNVNGHQYPDKLIYLHFLYVSPSFTQTEIRPDHSMTLSCQLILYDGGLCDTLVRFEGIQLSWVNQAGVDLQTDSRYQISSGHCNSTLTTKLLNEDNNRKWTCQVKKGTKVETSFSYSVKFGDRTTALIPVTTLNSAEQTSMPEEPVSHKPQGSLSTFVIVIIVVIAALAVVLLPAVFWMMCKKRADNRKEADDLAATDKNKYDGTICVPL